MLFADRNEIQKAYDSAKKAYAAFNVDTDKVIEDFSQYPISLHCWQGDDVKGFEEQQGVASQNLVTGSYKGAARNGSQLRQDIDKAFDFSPCSHRVNLHSIYANQRPKRSETK